MDGTEGVQYSLVNQYIDLNRNIRYTKSRFLNAQEDRQCILVLLMCVRLHKKKRDSRTTF